MWTPDAAIDFLKRAFGFEDTIVVRGDGDRVIHHAELRWPEGGGIMLGSLVGRRRRVRRPARRDRQHLRRDRSSRRPAASGPPPPVPTIVRGLVDEDYGSRGFTVRDPEGNLWSFGTYRGA